MDWVVFLAAGAITLGGAFGVILSRNPVHAALSLVMTLFGVAVLFVAQQAHFLAAVQVIVYAGAIVVLFLFVIMFLGVDKQENVAAEPLRGQRPAAIAVGVIALAEAFLLFRTTWATGRAAGADLAAQHGHDNTERLAETLFTRYVFPFEVTSVLLVIAVVGAVVLVRRSRGVEPTAPVEAAHRDKEGAPA
jgi:NADH-quinone oxidoreductase subunit J